MIAFEFAVFDEAGERLGGNTDERPRIFETGAGEMLPSLEAQLVDMEAQEARTVVLSPEQAYGPVQEEAFREVPLETLPEEVRQVGRKVVGRAPDGTEDLFDVVEIRDASAVIDMNHPLAGRTLRFELRVLHRGIGGDPQ